VASATQCISCIISGLWVRASKHWHSLTVSIRLLPTRQLFQSSLNTDRLCSLSDVNCGTDRDALRVPGLLCAHILYVYHVLMLITVHTGIKKLGYAIRGVPNVSCSRILQLCIFQCRIFSAPSRPIPYGPSHGIPFLLKYIEFCRF